MTPVHSYPVRKVPAHLRDRYVREGWWGQGTVGDLLADGLAAAPSAPFRVHSASRPYSGSLADVEMVARRLAAGLRRRGVGPGDVIAMQLPNWMEAAATFWASAFLGATIVPIVHFYGRKELAHIFRDTPPRVFITAQHFGRMSYEPDFCAQIPIVGVVGIDFDNLLGTEPMQGQMPADPSNVALIAYTSGTTSAPKGVLHTHQTLTCEARQLAALQPSDLGSQLTAAPVGHFIGMLGALLLPVLAGVSINLADTWDPARVLQLMREDGLTVGGGAPYFVTSLLEHPNFTDAHLPNMRFAGLGGATISPVLTRHLTDLGITVFRSYGSTEHPSITGCRYDDTAANRINTDGQALPGVELRLGDDGEILSRGPDLCLGYTDASLTEAVFDDHGWYHTGDIGVLDDNGYLVIADRKSDIIIRGGENISAIEVETVLTALSGVAEAVVVAVPDSRLGERAAAVFRMHAGTPAPTLSDVRLHCELVGLARQKWPEYVHTAEDFPRTASGKVQKFQVRNALATTPQAPASPAR